MPKAGLWLVYIALFTFISSSSSEAVTFTDISAESKVDNAGQSHGLLIADYDGDGDLDIYVVNMKGTPNPLYRNDGGGVFTDVATEAGVADAYNGHGGCFGDYDNDGNLDLYVANWDDNTHDPNLLFRNNGNRTFTDVTEGAGLSERPADSHGAIFMDYDNDGYLDIFVPSSYESSILYHNNDGETFTDVATEVGIDAVRRIHGMDSADYDNDGDLDIYVGDYDNPNALYRNNGGDTFTDVAAEAGVDVRENSHAISFCDYNNDGYMDIVVVNDDYHEDFIYKNNGGETFTKLSDEIGFVSSDKGVGVAIGDYDSDGDVDVYISNNGQNNRLLENQGGDTFSDATSGAGVGHPGGDRAPVFFDYDDDGDLDLYLCNRDGSNVLYRNEGTGNNYLKVGLVGTVSNRSGIGTRVRAVSGDLAQIRDLTGGGGAFQRLELYFGFGKRSQIDSLIVAWPSGNIDVLTSVEPNRKITVVEGQTTIVEETGTVKPARFALHQGYPNPFNSQIRIPFELGQGVRTSLSIYNILGQEVKTLMEVPLRSGSYYALWDGKDSLGQDMPSGLYICRMKAGSFEATSKVVLVK